MSLVVYRRCLSSGKVNTVIMKSYFVYGMVGSYGYRMFYISH